MKLVDFKNEIAESHLLAIEDRIREIWPGSDPKITLVIRTPWLEHGGILITNDSAEALIAETKRLFNLEVV